VNKEVRIVYLEDVHADAVRAADELRRGGVNVQFQRVDSKETFLRELQSLPDVILSDHGVPAFDGLMALDIAQEKCPDVPFIFVTNALSREMEIEKLTGGVADYVRKTQWDYLPVAVRHALHDAQERRRLRAEFAEKGDFKTGLLPICASCKKIRDAQNQWLPLETFFYDRLGINFTHSICPDCTQMFLREG